LRLTFATPEPLFSGVVVDVAKLTLFRTVREIVNYPLMGYSCPCPTIHANTAAVHNSSAVSLFLLLVVVATYVRASSAKRKRKAFSNDPKGGKGKAFLLTCAPLAAL